MSEPLWKAAEEASADLGQLAHGYRLLHESKTPGGRGSRVMRVALGPRPPVSAHLLDVIRDVEWLAYWADQTVSLCRDVPFIRYGLWWKGEPNPLVVESLVSASRNLPEAMPYAGQYVLELASETRRTLAAVHRLLGASGGAELADGDCPECQSPTLIRIYSPDRVQCASPGCDYQHRKESFA